MLSLSAIRPIKRAALSDKNMWRKLSPRYVTLGRKKNDIDKTNAPQVQTPAIEAQNCNQRSFSYATVSTGRDESNSPAAISETDAQRLRRRAKLLDRLGFLIGLIPIFGDITNTILAMALIRSCMKLGLRLPKSSYRKMRYNIIRSLVIGLCPVLGACLAKLYRCNKRNALILLPPDKKPMTSSSVSSQIFQLLRRFKKRGRE